MRKRSGFRALFLGLVLVAVVVAANAAPPTPVTAQASLPPLPAGWPSSAVQLGMADGPGGAASMRATAPFGFRYQYLSGGVGPGTNGWANWNSPSGAFATYYIQDSVNNGITPVLTYYQLRQSAPNNGLGDGDADYNNLQNPGTMAAYYADVRLFLQRAAAFPQTRVVLHVEPDLWGFLEQRATGDNAATVPAQVGSSGMPDVAGLPDNVSGFARAIVKLRDQYAPNVLLAYHVSVWGTGNDILYTRPDDATVTALATRAGNYFTSLQASFDVTFAEYSDRDAAFKQYVYGDGGASWWGPSDFNRNELFIGRFVSLTQKRVVFWQIPGGNTRMLAQNNTWQHYQDNKVEWLLDDPGRTNLSAYVQAGAIAFLFGRGADGATCYCDAANDGVTNPPAINGNTRPSLTADDDGGYFRERGAAYYSSGLMPLPVGGTSPTSTPTPQATSTSTPTPQAARTSTATPTATAATGTRTVTFDDLSSPNRVLTGQYPSNLIDWGTGVWYLSSPFGRFTTQSISFNGGGPTSAVFTFVAPQRLLQVDAYNGGAVASTVSLNCVGQTPRTVSLAIGQVMTISTGWTGACSSVTVGSSNGWDTNFDNLVVSSSAGATATSTPMPTSTPPATSTPTATVTPVVSSQTLTFDDLSSPGRALNGQYPTGVADWGTNTWYLSRPWGRFQTQSVSFDGPSISTASVNFVSARRVVRLDAYNGDTLPSTVTLTCTGQPTVTAVVGANQIVTIATNWSTTCTSVTISSSNGWNTNFDNLVIQ